MSPKKSGRFVRDDYIPIRIKYIYLEYPPPEPNPILTKTKNQLPPLKISQKNNEVSGNRLHSISLPLLNINNSQELSFSPVRSKNSNDRPPFNP